MASEAREDVCLLDVEASLEHFSQNKALHADTMLVVVEPYFRSLETGRRMVELGKQLEPERLVLVANKVRDARELEAVEELAASVGVPVAGAVPYDERLLDAERAGSALLDFDPRSPAVTALDELARELLETDGTVAGATAPRSPEFGLARAPGMRDPMTKSDEGMTPQHEEDIAQDERDAGGPESRADEDVSQQTSPPSNPETDDAAVEKGEDNLGRVVGR